MTGKAQKGESDSGSEHDSNDVTENERENSNDRYAHDDETETTM